MRLLNIFKSVIVLSKLEERDFETTKNTGQENLDKIIKLPKIVSFLAVSRGYCDIGDNRWLYDVGNRIVAKKLVTNTNCLRIPQPTSI